MKLPRIARQDAALGDILYLDVYSENSKGISLYQKFGFEILTAEPLADLDEGGKNYIIMAKRVSIAPTS